MNLIICLTTQAICLCVAAYYHRTKKKEWNVKDAEEANRKLLKKPCVDFSLDDQPAMTNKEDDQIKTPELKPVQVEERYILGVKVLTNRKKSFADKIKSLFT